MFVSRSPGPGTRPGGPGAGQPGGGGSPSGGAFVPVQNAPVQGTQSAICGNPVVAKYVRFSVSSATGQSVLTQTPDPTVTKFKGTVFDVTIPTQPVAVMNTKYYLQWYVNSLPQNKGCAANEPNEEVSFTVTATALPHRFTAFFKPGMGLPVNGHKYELKGFWLED